MRRELHRFFATNAEDSQRRQTIVKQRMNPLLQFSREVDHHIAAQNDMELIEGAIHGQIVL